MNYLDWRHASLNKRGWKQDADAEYLPDKQSAEYMNRKQQFADGLKAALPDAATWANQCTDCEACLKKCPQQIRIPNQMARIVETLRRR